MWSTPQRAHLGLRLPTRPRVTPPSQSPSSKKPPCPEHIPREAGGKATPAHWSLLCISSAPAATCGTVTHPSVGFSRLLGPRQLLCLSLSRKWPLTRLTPEHTGEHTQKNCPDLWGVPGFTQYFILKGKKKELSIFNIVWLLIRDVNLTSPWYPDVWSHTSLDVAVKVFCSCD